MIFLYCFFPLSQLLLVDGLSGKEGKDHILGGTRENRVAQIFQLGRLNRLFGDQRSDDEARLLSFQSAAESQSFDYSVGGIFLPMKRILGICCQSRG